MDMREVLDESMVEEEMWLLKAALVEELLGLPHCWYRVPLSPVALAAIVVLVTWGGGRGPVGWEAYPFCTTAWGFHGGYWWKSPPPLARWAGEGSLRGDDCMLERVSTGMGDLGSGGRLSKGIEVMTPAVMERTSASWPMSRDCTDALLVCREEREPDGLPGGAGASKAPLPE